MANRAILDEFAHSRAEELLDIARNPAAQNRREAIRALVERGSPLAMHPDIVVEATELIYQSPVVLKQANPIMAAAGHRLPGLLEVVARTVSRVTALEVDLAALRSEEAAHTVKAGLRTNRVEDELIDLRDDLADTIAKLGTGLTDRIATEEAYALCLHDRIERTSSRATAIEAELERLRASRDANAALAAQALSLAEELQRQLAVPLWRRFVNWLSGKWTGK